MLQQAALAEAPHWSLCWLAGVGPRGPGPDPTQLDSHLDGAQEVPLPKGAASTIICLSFPKRDGGMRPILDLRCLNGYFKHIPFHMLTLKEVICSVRLHDWIATVD